MKQKIFLTSIIAMGFVAPAFAEMTDSNTFPDASQGEYMQANTRYIGAATSDNMAGVYENDATVDAVAEYEDVLYQIVAGQYLPAGAESPIDCNQSGYFCAGVQNGVYYDANNNQGLTSCSDATNGAYTLSAGTGDSVNSCYRTCTNNDVAHSRGTLNGGYYYGNNNQCEPTDCVDGWHIKQGLNLTTTIGVSEAGVDNGYINEAGDENKYIYGITQNGEFVVDYGNKGIIKGHAKCSTRSATDPWVGNNGDYVLQSDGTTSTLPESSGEYCYCKLDSYTPLNGTAIVLSAPWVFRSYESSCEYSCADNCSYNLWTADSNYLAFRTVVLGSVESSPASCEANIININWSNADAADITANNAGTATYDSDIRTPVKAQTIKGKTFRGWRFSKPEQTNLP